jgi:hypothetical protein
MNVSTRPMSPHGELIGALGLAVQSRDRNPS